MAAEESGQATFVPRSVSEDARRMWRASSIWIFLAAAVWVWFAYLMLGGYGPEDTSTSGSDFVCQGPLIDPLPGNNVCHSELRQWPVLLGILALAVITSVAAAASSVYAMVLSRLGRSGAPSTPSQS
ncbi:hypothetical protein [Streptomyces luteolus]|uniref:Integral membrane protein n=1 Tax=Streptomyces luteolus TaxID=3043615 RepID=A0ABT6SQT8_9ACTN|nr:hypothetical protein [Streptomyces sp. B-S-A12]MDI3417945.1 hypothetical protein [Streptomyces sp. B-S-A12]